MNKNKLTYAEAHNIARELGASLGEKQHAVIGQIRRIVQLCGVEFARDMYATTQEIEATGGMMVSDNSRRRTPGGVFLRLVYDKLNDDQRKHIFGNRSNQGVPLLAWKKRIVMIEALRAEQGTVKSLKVSLCGRVEQVEKQADVVVITLIDEISIGNLPRVLPRPPSTPTVVTVYATREQWETVETAQTNPPERLVVEGNCAFDPEIKRVVVFAASVQVEELKT